MKLVIWFKRRSGTDVEAFHDEWKQDAHVDLVRRLPALRGYTQSHVLVSGYRKGEPFCDGVSELWFADRAALDAARKSSEFAAAQTDAMRFADPSTAGSMTTVEHLIKNGPKPPGGVKNIEFVVRRRDLDVREFHRYWREFHGPLASHIAPIRRYVQSHAVDDPETRAYDGIASTWFDDTAAMRLSATTDEYRATREDEPNFISGHLPFVIAREHVFIHPPI